MDDSCREISPDECRRFLGSGEGKGCVILDVRTPAEFREGHLAGALNIDFFTGDFRERISQLGRSRYYVVYCKLGNRGHRTLDLMHGLGFTHVSNIRGGIMAWQGAGLPVEK